MIIVSIVTSVTAEAATQETRSRARNCAGSLRRLGCFSPRENPRG